MSFYVGIPSAVIRVETLEQALRLATRYRQIGTPCVVGAIAAA